MDALKKTVHLAMMEYAKKGLNSQSYLTRSDDNTVLTVVTIPQQKAKPPFISLLVRIIDQHILIERDQNDKPLIDALLQASIPRSQIILVYKGENTPETA